MINTLTEAAKALQKQVDTPVIKPHLACDTCSDSATAVRYGEGKWCDVCYDIYMDAKAEYEMDELRQLEAGMIEEDEDTGWIEYQMEADRQIARMNAF